MNQSVLLTFKDRKAFADNYDEASPTRGFYVPGYPDVKPGDTVNLEIVFVKEVISFHAAGVVQTRYTTPGGDELGGFRVALRPSTEDHTAHLIIQFVRGTMARDLKRRPRRFRVCMPVDLTADQTFASEFTADVSKGGAFIKTESLLDAGTLLALRIRPPEEAPIELNAEVARRQSGPEAGIGVNFVIGNPVVQQRINRLIDQLARNSVAQGVPNAA